MSFWDTGTQTKPQAAGFWGTPVAPKTVASAPLMNPKIAQYNAETDQYAQKAKAANSFWGTAKNTVAGLPSAALGVGKDIARGAAEFGVSAGEAGPRLANPNLAGAILPPKKIPGLGFLGPVQSFESQSAQAVKDGASVPKAIAGGFWNTATNDPIGVAAKPILIGAGVLGKVARPVLDELAKTHVVQDVLDTLGKHFPNLAPEKAAEIAPQIASTNDANAIEKTIADAHAPTTQKFWDSAKPTSETPVPNGPPSTLNLDAAPSEVDRLISEGKVRIVSRNGTDVYQIQKARKWVNTRDESSAIAQVTREPKIDNQDLRQNIENEKANLSVIKDALAEHPGKALTKYKSAATGDLPYIEKGAKSAFGKKGDVIGQNAIGQDMTGGGDYEVMNQHLHDYEKLREQKAAAQEAVKGARQTLAGARADQKSLAATARMEPSKNFWDVPKTPNAALIEPTNKVELPVKGASLEDRVRSAVANSESIRTQLLTRGQDTYSLGRVLDPADLKLAEQYEHGTPMEELITQAKNPAQFSKFMSSLVDYYDFRLAADRAAGGTTVRVENYLPHEWDLTNPEDLARFNKFAEQKGLRPYKGYHSQPRVFGSYAEGEAFGFTRKRPNVLADLRHDYMTASPSISKQALKQGLGDAAPDLVSMSGMGITAKGKPFVNSNIPGLEGISYDPSIARLLKGFEALRHPDFVDLVKKSGAEAAITRSGIGGAIDKGAAMLTSVPASAREAGFTGVLGSIFDHVSAPLKQILWNWSGFHSINITLNYVGASALHPLTGSKGVIQSVASLASERLFQKFLTHYKGIMLKDPLGRPLSVFDWAVKSGAYEARGLPAVGLKRLNPLTGGQRAIFDREIPILQLNLAEQAAKRGVDAESPAGRAIGREIRTITGEINARTMNLNPNNLRVASRAFLAPGFTYSKYKTLFDSLSAWNQTNRAAGNLARTAVVGKSGIIGGIATLGTLLATGRFPNLQQLLLNFTLDPTTQTNLLNPKGQKQDIVYPKTFVSEPAGAVLDPVHYAEARLNPVIADTVKVYSNKDYYGNPIVDPNSKEPAAAQYATGIGLGHLPIGAQSIANQALGKQNAAQSAIQIAGLRTRLSASDPTAIKYKGIDDAKAAIAGIAGSDPERTQKMQTIFAGLSADQRKSLNYQLMLQGVSTKGVSMSDTGILYQQVQGLVQAGKQDEADTIINGLTDDQYKAYTTYKHTYDTSSLRDLLKSDPANAVTFLRSKDPAEQNRLLNIMTDGEYAIYEQAKNSL